MPCFGKVPFISMHRNSLIYVSWPKELDGLYPVSTVGGRGRDKEEIYCLNKMQYFNYLFYSTSMKIVGRQWSLLQMVLFLCDQSSWKEKSIYTIPWSGCSSRVDRVLQASGSWDSRRCHMSGEEVLSCDPLTSALCFLTSTLRSKEIPPGFSNLQSWPSLVKVQMGL